MIYCILIGSQALKGVNVRIYLLSVVVQEIVFMYGVRHDNNSRLW